MMRTKTVNPRYEIERVQVGVAYPKNGNFHNPTKYYCYNVVDTLTGRAVFLNVSKKRHAVALVSKYAGATGIIE